MGSGGARATSGPPPDPMALRRDRKDDGEWVTLPRDGRAGDPPEWPLTKATIRERHVWGTLWAKPQAVQWEKLGMTWEVALYTRRLVEAEKPRSAVGLSTLVRQMGDALGLTIPGMRVNRWKLAGTPEAKAPARKAAPTPQRQAARDRFRVIDGAAG